MSDLALAELSRTLYSPVTLLLYATAAFLYLYALTTSVGRRRAGLPAVRPQAPGAQRLRADGRHPDAGLGAARVLRPRPADADPRHLVADLPRHGDRDRRRHPHRRVRLQRPAVAARHRRAARRRRPHRRRHRLHRRGRLHRRPHRGHLGGHRHRCGRGDVAERVAPDAADGDDDDHGEAYRRALRAAISPWRLAIGTFLGTSTVSWVFVATTTLDPSTGLQRFLAVNLAMVAAALI